MCSIIGISGKAGSGKTTAAEFLVSELGYDRRSFAAGVKQEVAELLTESGVSFTEGNLYGTQAQRAAILSLPRGRSYFPPALVAFLSWCNQTGAPYSFRALLQWYGTEYRRAQDPNYWCHKLITGFEVGGLYVVDDVRFENEASTIRAMGGVLFRLERPDAPCLKTAAHASETALDKYRDFDAFIVNDGGEDLFYNRLLEAVGVAMAGVV